MEMNLNTLIKQAKQETGLTDFGNEFFFEPLKVMVDSFNKEADLNQVGAYMMNQRLLNTLKNRLRMEEWIKQTPEILDEEIKDPVVIVGLPRTGTTMLHRILASDSRFHAPLWYEVRNPAPYMDVPAAEKDPRIIEAEAEVAEMLAANPELKAIHPMDPVGADEEILLLEHCGYSYMPNSWGNLPSYLEWIKTHDNTIGYEDLKRQLKFLQWQKKQRGEQAERWLLKAPHHLHFLDVLMNVFPDAKVVMTHRDPVLSIPSICSFIYNMWLVCSDSADKKVAAEQWGQLFTQSMNKTLVEREQFEARIMDLKFKDTVQKPFECIEQLYDFIGMELTAEARAAMQLHRDENKRSDRPLHEYTLEEYGLEEARINTQLAEYIARFIA